MSKKDKRKNQRGPLTPRKKPESRVWVDADEDSAMTQFFGYDTPSTGAAGAFFGEEAAKCMATEVIASDLEQLKADGIEAHPGQWIISSGGCDWPGGIKKHGPFSKMEEAFDFAKTTYGAIRWTSGVFSG